MKTPNKETTGHTPGPWTAERMFNPPKSKDRRCGFVVNGPENGEPLPPRICDLRVPPGLGSFSEYQANAKLIASAPDLLQALRGVQSYLDELSRMQPNRDRGTEFDRIRELVQDAIAKSQGKA